MTTIECRRDISTAELQQQTSLLIEDKPAQKYADSFLSKWSSDLSPKILEIKFSRKPFTGSQEPRNPVVAIKNSSVFPGPGYYFQDQTSP